MVRNARMSLSPRISLHLGAHKTASTHLQKSLQRSPGRLAPAGIRFLGPKFLRDPDHKLAQVTKTNGPDLGDLFGEDPLMQLSEGAGRLVLSDENLLGPVLTDLHPGVLYPRARGRIERLLGALAPAPVTLFIGIRDPGSWLVSLYSQRIKGGHYMRFEDFCAGFVPTDLRWAGLVQRLLGLDGHQGIVVWSFEDYAKLGDKLLAEMLGKPPPKGVRLLDKRVNSSISAAAMETLLDMHGQGQPPRQDWGKSVSEKYPLSDKYPAYDPWSDAEKDLSQAAYQADIDQIKSMTNVTFLTPGTP